MHDGVQSVGMLSRKRGLLASMSGSSTSQHRNLIRVYCLQTLHFPVVSV